MGRIGGFKPLPRPNIAVTKYADPERNEPDMSGVEIAESADQGVLLYMTDRQRQFVEVYLATWDVGTAARSVGYANNVARAQGRKLLENPFVRAEIQRRLDEKVMSADEVLTRLSRQGRGSMASFIDVTPQGPAFNFEKAAALGQLDLIKKMKIKTKVLVSTETNQRSGRRGETSAEESNTLDMTVLSIEVDFELYDSQAALKLMGQAHELFVEKRQIDGNVTLNIEYGNADDGGDSDDPTKTNIHQRRSIPAVNTNPLDRDDTDAEVGTFGNRLLEKLTRDNDMEDDDDGEDSLMSRIRQRELMDQRDPAEAFADKDAISADYSVDDD